MTIVEQIVELAENECPLNIIHMTLRGDGYRTAEIDGGIRDALRLNFIGMYKNDADEIIVHQI